MRWNRRLERNWGRLGMKYKTYQLQEVCSFIDYRGKTPPKTTEGIPLITAKIVKNGMIQKPQEFIAADFYDEWMRRGIPKKGSVIFTTEAPLGEVARIQTDEKLAFAQRIIIMEPDTDLLDADYLFYALQDITLKSRIQARATGTTVIGIKSAELKKVLIDLPTLNVQKKIASILSAFDDKIALNQQINNNLEQQAQAIYTLLFIENRNPQWKEGVLSDLITIKYGKDHKKLNDGIYPVYGSGGIMRFVDTPIYTGESVLIPRKGTLNNVMYVDRAFWSVDTMFYTEMLCPNVAKFVYHFVKGIDLASLNAGSAVPSMTTKILNAIKLYIPDNETLQKFEEIVQPMYQIMQENEKQTLNLASIRNILLPRLMSGEVEISDIYI